VLPTAAKVESGTSQSKSGTSVNLGNGGFATFDFFGQVERFGQVGQVERPRNHDTILQRCVRPPELFIVDLKTPTLILRVLPGWRVAPLLLVTAGPVSFETSQDRLLSRRSALFRKQEAPAHSACGIAS